MSRSSDVDLGMLLVAKEDAPINLCDCRANLNGGLFYDFMIVFRFVEIYLSLSSRPWYLPPRWRVPSYISDRMFVGVVLLT